jgi:hypothetical protein
MGADDARERLSAHIGVDLPWWGRLNVNPERDDDGVEGAA